MFDPAIVTTSDLRTRIHIQATRALEFGRPELTSQRRDFAYELADDPRTAAIEVAAFIDSVR
ncbi:MAG: hypothetical protein JO036_21915 [Candidatus Eremiobacteraeota bacterium]|nr:hypothetical protein [Candidatus Eremiobacteraeota bacterium]